MDSLTPCTTKLLIAAMLAAGYIENSKNYPVVAELPTGFLFIAVEDNYTDDGDPMFIVSEFLTKFKQAEYRWAPHDEKLSLDEALVSFHKVYAEKLIK
jgi:hypothetical protein